MGKKERLRVGQRPCALNFGAWSTKKWPAGLGRTCYSSIHNTAVALFSFEKPLTSVSIKNVSVSVLKKAWSIGASDRWISATRKARSVPRRHADRYAWRGATRASFSRERVPMNVPSGASVPGALARTKLGFVRTCDLFFGGESCQARDPDHSPPRSFG